MSSFAGYISMGVASSKLYCIISWQLVVFAHGVNDANI